MAIVNNTPDSFYSHSRTQSYDAVAERVREAITEGATIIDIGGYSSRPDADDVAVEEEWGRVEMALKATRAVSQDIAISIDTFRAEVVRRAVAQFGDIIVNDIQNSRYYARGVARSYTSGALGGVATGCNLVASARCTRGCRDNKVVRKIHKK